MPKISVVLGDARSARLCELLSEDGYETRLFTPAEKDEAAVWGDVVVLPIKGMPSEEMNGLMKDNQVLVSGADFLSRDDFAVLNAIPILLSKEG